MEEDERYPTRVMLTSVVLNSISLFILHTPKRNPLECIGITVLVLESNWGFWSYDIGYTSSLQNGISPYQPPFVMANPSHSRSEVWTQAPDQDTHNFPFVSIFGHNHIQYIYIYIDTRHVYMSTYSKPNPNLNLHGHFRFQSIGVSSKAIFLIILGMSRRRPKRWVTLLWRHRPPRRHWRASLGAWSNHDV